MIEPNFTLIIGVVGTLIFIGFIAMAIRMVME